MRKRLINTTIAIRCAMDCDSHPLLQRYNVSHALAQFIAVVLVLSGADDRVARTWFGSPIYQPYV